MRFIYLSIGVLVFFGLVNAVIEHNKFEVMTGQSLGFWDYPTILSTNIAEGVGSGFAVVLLACLGLINTKRRFLSFAVFTGVFSLLAIYLLVFGLPTPDEDDVIVFASVDAEECGEDRPLKVTIFNNSDQRLDAVDFRVVAYTPGRSTVQFAKTLKSDFIVQTGESDVICYPPFSSIRPLSEVTRYVWSLDEVVRVQLGG